MATTGTETSTLMSTQNADNVAITGGSISGTNMSLPSGRVGTFTLNGATPVTVTNTNVAISDVIPISLKTVGGTVGAIPAIQTITAATGFTVAGTASDTSVYNYCLIKTA